MRMYKCLICGTECTSRDKRSKLCKSKECFREFYNRQYSEQKSEKSCKKCGMIFTGTYREVLCHDCKHLPRDFSHLSVDREYKCIRCGQSLGKSKVIKMGKYKADRSINRSHSVCDNCKNKSRELYSKSRLGKNNPNWKGGTVEKVKETPEQTAERMRNNNPMYDPAVIAKMKSTVAQRIANGNIIYKRGIKRSVVYKMGRDHHLWKGNRRRSQVIRSRLYSAWILPQMNRDNFHCTECGQNRCRLEVHHVSEKFSDILSKFCPRPLDDLTQEEFENVSAQVVDYHKNNVIGRTLCVPCHKRVDPNRK